MTTKPDCLPQNLHRACIFNLSPEFPAKPFLAIEGSERKRHVGLVNNAFRGGDWLDKLTKFQRIPWLNIFHWGSDQVERLCENPNRKVVAFDMDWNLTNEQLRKLFDAWVKEERRRGGPKPREARGAGGSERRLRTGLKKLGALRLLREMSWDIAATASQRISGKALYEEQPAWSRANGDAQRITDNDFTLRS